MNAADPLKPAQAAADQRSHEPSMEEILASIRRIIADDQSLPNRAFLREEEVQLRASLDAAPKPEMGAEPMAPELVVAEFMPIDATAQSALNTQNLRDLQPAAPVALPFPAFASHAELPPVPPAAMREEAQDSLLQDSLLQDSVSQDRSSQAGPAQGRVSQNEAVRDTPIVAQAAPSPRAVPTNADQTSATWKAESQTPKAGAMPPRIVPPNATLGHIAAPQFAMPDTPVAGRGVPHQRRDEGMGEAPLLRFQGAGPADPSKSLGGMDRPASEATPIGNATRTSPTNDRDLDTADAAMSDAMSNLFSSSTDQTVTAAFKTLAATRLLENDDVIKDMARDLIRPMLKSWLDDNLPSMVERMVRAEIERVARGGR